MRSLRCSKHVNIFTPGSIGGCSPKLSCLPLPVPSHFQVLSQARQPWVWFLFSNIGSSLIVGHGLHVTLLEMFVAQCFQATEALYLFMCQMQSTAISLR